MSTSPLASLLACLKAATSVPGSWRTIQDGRVQGCGPHPPLTSGQLVDLIDDVMRDDKKLVVTREYDITCVARPDEDGVHMMTHFGLGYMDHTGGGFYPAPFMPPAAERRVKAAYKR